MQSNPAENPITQLQQASQVAPVAPPISPAATATAQVVTGKLNTQVGSPLDFIRQNLRQEEPQFNPQEVVATEEAKRQEAAQAEAIEEPAIEVEDEKSVSEVQDKSTEGVTSENGEGSPESDISEFSDTSDSTAENFKKLRTKAKEATKKAKELEEKAKELETKVKEYETGAIVPEVLQSKESEIQRLSYYEKLFNFKGTKEYQDKFLKPVTELQTRLGDIAKDYEIPEEVMQEALTLTNKKELNSFLSSHFDDVGALEVKDIVGKIQTIQHEALEAEKAPQESLNRLVAENQQIAEQRRAERTTNVVNTSKSAWVEVLSSIQNEAKIPELTTIPGNNEHNEKIVKPHRVAAATEYGKIVKLLAQSGLETISPELASALAKSVLLAHVSATAIASRNHTAKEFDKLATNTKRTTSYERPPVGGSFASSSGSGPEQKKPSTPQEAAAQHINSILSNSKR